MKTVAIIQARMGSSRMPGKVLKSLAGKPVLWHIINRLKKTRTLNDIVIATTTKEEDEPVVKFAKEENVKIFRGSEDNVLKRYYIAAKQFGADIIVRVTGDAPLVDPKTIDLLVNTLNETKSDFCTLDPREHCIHEGFSPFTFNGLKKLITVAGDDPVAIEHITAYFKKHPDFVKTAYVNVNPEHKFSGARISVDTPADFEFLEELHKRLNAKPGEIKIKDVVELLKSEPQLLRINSHVYQKKAEEKTKKILFRCDGDHKIGLGHVYRCIALADELRDRYGFGITFAMQSGKVGFKIVSETGFEIIHNNGDSENKWFDTTIDRVNPNCIILDVRTDLSAKIIQKWKDKNILIATIDDPSERRLVSDLAFYPPVPQVKKFDWTNYSGELYHGHEWVLLRQEFRQKNRKIKFKYNEIPIVLVSMGGSDPSGLTIKVVEALNKIEDDFETLIILGPGFKDHIILEKILSKAAIKFQIYWNPEYISSIFSKADFAIASFGVTAYELAALGIPSVLLCLTKDHFESASALVKIGMGQSISPNNINNINLLANILNSSIRDINKHKSKTPNTLIDGLGACRIASVIKQKLRN